jgi:hypothetical protein
MYKAFGIDYNFLNTTAEKQEIIPSTAQFPERLSM